MMVNDVLTANDWLKGTDEIVLMMLEEVVLPGAVWGRGDRGVTRASISARWTLSSRLC
jgi:hypothetical protein